MKYLYKNVTSNVIGVHIDGVRYDIMPQEEKLLHKKVFARGIRLVEEKVEVKKKVDKVKKVKYEEDDVL